MKTLLIEVPDGWTVGLCGSQGSRGSIFCPMWSHCNHNKRCPLANAKEAVEVKSTDKMIRQPSNARLEINGNSVTLYAVKRTI